MSDDATQPDDTHTEGGAPTDAAHEAAGDGTSQGGIPAGLTPEEMQRVAEEQAGNDGGAG